MSLLQTLLAVVMFAAAVVVPLVLIVAMLRSALKPIEEQLRRIADEIEIRNTLDADDAAPSLAGLD